MYTHTFQEISLGTNSNINVHSRYVVNCCRKICSWVQFPCFTRRRVLIVGDDGVFFARPLHLMWDNACARSAFSNAFWSWKVTQTLGRSVSQVRLVSTAQISGHEFPIPHSIPLSGRICDGMPSSSKGSSRVDQVGRLPIYIPLTFKPIDHVLCLKHSKVVWICPQQLNAHLNVRWPLDCVVRHWRYTLFYKHGGRRRYD